MDVVKIPIAIVGSVGGKSCIINRFIKNKFEHQGSNYSVKHVIVDGKNVQFELWDTSASERLLPLLPFYLRGTKGVMLVYDLTSKDTFDTIKDRIDFVLKNAPRDVIKILIGNKYDIKHKRQVSVKQATEFALAHDMKYIEVSALSGHNIEEAFITLAKDVINKNSIEKDLLFIGFERRVIKSNDEEVEIQIWDADGDNSANCLNNVKLYSKAAKVVVFLFNTANEQSYKDIDEWIWIVKQHVSVDIPKMIVGKNINDESLNISIDFGHKHVSVDIPKMIVGKNINDESLNISIDFGHKLANIHGYSYTEIKNNGDLQTILDGLAAEYFELNKRRTFVCLKEMGFETANDFIESTKFGTYKCYWNSIYLVGQYSAGKSTLANVLLREAVPKARRATDGIWIHRGKAGMDIAQKRWVVLYTGNISSDVLANMLMSLSTKDKHNLCVEQKDLHTHKRQSHDQQISPVNQNLASNKTEVKSEQHQQQNDDENKGVLSVTTQITIGKQSSITIRDDEAIFIPNMTRDYNAHIHQLVIQAIKDGRYEQQIVPFDIWDFGGQKDFHKTHQLFITSRGIFVLMFNGSIIPEFDENHRYADKAIVADYLLHWVNSILTYCKMKIDGFPRIVFVATHKDKISQIKVEGHRRRLINSIKEMFKSHAGYRHLEFEQLIFIDSRNENDPEIKVLQDRLINLAMEHPRWGEEMPTLWVPLELQLLEKVDQGTNILTKDQLRSLNSQNDAMELSERQLSTFLRVQHSLGKLLYFDEAHLSNYVIISPVYMVEVLRSIVTDKQFWPREKQYRNILQELQDTGSITKANVFILWQQEDFQHILPFKEFMIDILVHLDIFILPLSNEDDCTEHKESGFLVPCMIETHNATGYMKDNCKAERSIIMAYTFVDGVIPPAFTFRFLGSFVAMWKIKSYRGRQLLSRDLAVVEIDDSHDVAINVIGNRVVVSLIHAHTTEKIVPTLASSVQECLTAAVHRISDFYSTLSEDRLLNASSSGSLSVIPFDIEFGVVCKRWFQSSSLCFFKSKEMPSTCKTRWKCPHGYEHDIKYHFLWFAEKKSTDGCTESCPGLGRLELEQSPQTKHIRRFVTSINIEQCRQVSITLGLSLSVWDDMEYQFQHQSPDDLKLTALMKWRETNKNATFRSLQEALENCEINRHCLCQVFRDVNPEIGSISEEVLRSTPSLKTLHLVSNHVGNSSVQLAVELDFEMAEIQDIQYQYRNKLLDQTREILKRWRNSNTNPTTITLLKALYRIGKIGCLRDVFFQN